MRQTNRFFFCGHTSGKVAEFHFSSQHGPRFTRWVAGPSLPFSAVPVAGGEEG